MSIEVKGSLNQDVNSLNNNQKYNLTEYSFVAAKDVGNKKGKARKTIVELGEVNGIKLFVTAIDDSMKRHRQTTEDKIKALGLDLTITHELLTKKNDGKIKSYHIDDIIETNLVEDISKLDQESQKQITENIIKNRNEYSLQNKEEISLFILRSGKINRFLLEHWYAGILRTIEKLICQADVKEEIVNELSLEENRHLKSRVKKLIILLQKLISLLEKAKSQR